MASTTRVDSTEEENHVTSPPHLARGVYGSTSLEEDSTFPADCRLYAQHATRLAGVNMRSGARPPPQCGGAERIPLPNVEIVGGEALAKKRSL